MPQAVSQKQVATKTKKTKKRKQHRPISFLNCQSLTHVVGFPPQNELVTTPVASELVKEIFLERFVKEIVRPFQPDKTKKRNNGNGNNNNNSFNESGNNAGYYHVMVDGKLLKKRRKPNENPTGSTTKTAPSSDKIDETLERKRKLWKKNIVIGSNQCLRILETACANHKDGTELTDNVVGQPQPSLIVLAKDMYPPTLCVAIPVMAQSLGIPLLLLPGKASMDLGKALNAKRASVVVFLSKQDDGNSKHSNEQEENTRTSISSFVSFIKDQISPSMGKEGA